MNVRSPSLFVTFAASFLAVLLLGAVLQALVLVWLVQPLWDQWETSRAGGISARSAREISLAGPQVPDGTIAEILARNSMGEERLSLAYLTSDGRAVGSSELPPVAGMFFQRLVQNFENGNPELANPDPMERPAPDGRRRGFGPPNGGGGRDALFDRRGQPRRPLRVVSVDTVREDDAVVGRVIALLPPLRWHQLGRGSSRNLLGFVPVAILLSAIGGLVVFRLLVRRIRSLEVVADRWSQGDLDARVPNPGQDELGRLSTRLNTMASNLSQARQQIESNEIQRRRLLADISHELATPLTSIRGYTETLLNPSIEISDEERKRYMENSLEEAERMDHLVQGLLDLSRLEAGATNTNRERIDWSSLCSHTLQRFRSQFEEGELRLVWQGDDQPAWIEADGRRMEQVIDNLLSNALRYVPRGGTVEVQLETLASESGASTHRLHVRDDGPGFTENDLPLVFERFYRGDRARTSEGTGLGLAIVQEIIQQHDGRVSAQNRKNGGASVTIELPSA